MPVVSSRMNVISAGSRPKQSLPHCFISCQLLPFLLRFLRSLPLLFFLFSRRSSGPRCFSFHPYLPPSSPPGGETGLFCNAASRGKWDLDPDEKTRRRCLIVDVVPRRWFIRRFSSFPCVFFCLFFFFFWKSDAFFFFWTRTARSGNFGRIFWTFARLDVYRNWPC